MTGIVGLDLSLTATGICDSSGRTRTIGTKGLDGMERIDYILRGVIDTITSDVTHVAIEGYSFAAPFQAHQMGELGGVIRRALWLGGLAWWDIAPMTLKKFATGVGKGRKEAIVPLARERLGYGGFDDNEADALWLWHIGNHLNGNPLVSLPKDHLDALKAPRAKGPHQRRKGGVIDVADTKGRL